MEKNYKKEKKSENNNNNKNQIQMMFQKMKSLFIKNNKSNLNQNP